MEIREGFMPYLEYKTYYRIVGENTGNKKPLVLLHGGPGSTHNYFEVLDRKDGLLVGRYGGSTRMEEQFHMATMEEKDFLAGKDNWTVLEY